MTRNDRGFPPHTGGRVRDLSQEGEGILALNSPDPAWQGRVVFVPDTVPGDEVEVLAYAKRGKSVCVTDYDLLAPSADRQEPFCPHFGACGGCQLQNLHYQATLDWKRKHIEDLLRRLAKLDLPEGLVQPCLATPPAMSKRQDTSLERGSAAEGNGENPQAQATDHSQALAADQAQALVADQARAFRSIVRLHVNPAGQLCFFGLRPNELIPLETCPIQSPQLNALRELINMLLRDQPSSEVAKLTSVELRQNAAASLKAADPKHVSSSQEASYSSFASSPNAASVTRTASPATPASNAILDPASTSPEAPALMVTFNFHEEPLAPDWQDFFTELLDQCRDILAPASLSPWLAVGEDYVHIAGPKQLRMTENGLDFDFSPRAFQQTNLWLNHVLYQEVIKAAQMLKITGQNQEALTDPAANRASESAPLNILELYCGSGTISLHLARAFPEAKLTGVEIVPEAIEDAKHNAELNGLAPERLHFLVGDAGQALRGDLPAETFSQATDQAQTYIADLSTTQPAYDLLVLDPPRQGLDPQLCQDILHSGIPHVVYVSCDPATLARDLKTLKQAYKLQTVQPLDMFPWTTHVETVVLMSRIER